MIWHHLIDEAIQESKLLSKALPSVVDFRTCSTYMTYM
jgi:hypothetical protein